MVPILHYFFGYTALESTVLSMAVVGTAALVGSFSYWKSNEVNIKVGVSFALPSLIAVTIVRAFVLPMIPSSIWKIGNFELTKENATLIFFSTVMFAVAAAMLKAESNSGIRATKSYSKILNYSIGVGSLTGFVGAGGGFLIVPALHLLLGLPMRIAVGTSLFVIFINSIVGFGVELYLGTSIPWKMLLSILAASVAGLFVGLRFSKKVPQATLKKIFAFFIIIVATSILAKEFL